MYKLAQSLTYKAKLMKKLIKSLPAKLFLNDNLIFCQSFKTHFSSSEVENKLNKKSKHF